MRLEEIKKRQSDLNQQANGPAFDEWMERSRADIAWLLARVERLEAAVEFLISDGSHWICDVYGVRSCFECGAGLPRIEPFNRLPDPHSADCPFAKAVSALKGDS